MANAHMATHGHDRGAVFWQMKAMFHRNPVQEVQETQGTMETRRAMTLFARGLTATLFPKVESHTLSHSSEC